MRIYVGKLRKKKRKRTLKPPTVIKCEAKRCRRLATRQLEIRWEVTVCNNLIKRLKIIPVCNRPEHLSELKGRFHQGDQSVNNQTPAI